MEGEEQTTISPEFLENIQSAVNSQGVLGQVQVIQTENGPVTVLFMEEGADTSNIGSDNITLTVSDGNLVDAGIEDQNSQVQFQYQVQPDEDYTQFLQSGNAEIVSTTETVKDVAASVEPVIGISEQGTVESAQEKGAESNDTYFITDTGEILKIDSSLLGDSGETFQLQTQDGTYQVLNQLGSVQTSSSNDTQARYSQPVIENTNVTFKESAPFEYTATKVEAPLVIDTSRVEEPKVLSYKTTNRQRTNIMRQPVSKPSPVNFQSKPVVTNQNVKTQTSLLSNAHYKTVKQVDPRSKTTEIVYPKSYQKQTLVFPKVQKQAQQGSVIKTDQAGYQPQMITTVVNPQSLLKPGVDQSFSVGQALKKFNTSQIQGSSMTTQSLYAKKPMPEVNKFTSQVVSRQIPAVTKQQTDLLSVAMKQAEVPEQVLSSIPTVPKKILEPVVKDLVPANHLGDKALSEKLQGVKGSLQDIAVAKPLQEITPDPVSFAGAVPVMEKQSSTEQQTVLQPAAEITSGVATVTEKVSPAVENAVSQTDGLDESEMETDAWQQIEDNQPKVDQKAADQMTDKLEVSETGTSQNQVHTGPFKCPTCKAAFKKKVDYNAHRKVHKEEWLGKWREICDTEPEINVLARMTKYKGRKLTGRTKTKTVKPGKCNICNRTFATLRALMLHKKQVHRTKAKDVDRLHYKVFAVSELSVKEKEALSFKKNSFQFENFQAEDMNESETDEKMLRDNKGKNVNIDSLRTIFQCDFCKQCFISEEEVLAHVKIHQTVCSVCKSILHDYTSLQKHRVFSHANVEGANFPCVKCKKMFITQGDLHYHLKIHDGPWICEYTACKAVFSEKENFDKHIAMHQEEKFVCVCERRFMKEEDLKRHVRTKKGKCQPPQKPVEGSEPVLDIPVSEVNSYIDKGVDIVIEGKGTIIAPFKCKICSAQFVSHSFTKRHILLRHCKNVEERQLRCSICGFKSNCSDGMKTHLKNHDQSVSETGGEICENDDDTDNSETIKNSIEDILNINQTREIDRPASNNENNKIVKDSQQLQGELDNAVENDSSKNGNCNESDEITENVTVFHDRSDSVLSVEKVQIQTDVTLNEMSQPTMDTVELHPPQTLQPQDPGPLSSQEAYDDLVDQIGTILTEEVWSTAQIKDRSSSLIQEKQNHNIFEYKGMVPEGLESYIPTVGPYVCSGCGVPCDGQDKFKCHVLTHHTEGLLCKLCKKKPTSSKNLLGHMIDKHLEGKPLTCPKCGGAFKKLNFYWRHAKAHTVSHVCEFCKKQFNRKSDLTEHLHSHVEQKQFCVRCGETFDTADQLRMHTWKAHNIILHKNKNRRKRMRVNTQPNSDKISKGHTIRIYLEKNEEATETDDNKETEEANKGSELTKSVEESANTQLASQPGSEMKSIDVPDSDVTIQLFADGTLVTRDKAGTNYSQVKLEDLGLDLSMLEGNTDIELLIVQGDGKEVRATINTSKDVNPTTASVTQPSKTASSTSVASNVGQGSKETIALSKTLSATAPINEARPYKCSMCPRTFKFYRTFRCHEIVHTKAVTFTCHLCQRLFAREVNLQSHLELHKKKGAMRPTEESRDIKSRQCPHCKKIYGDVSKMQRHVREQHEQKKIPCPICAKLFTSESNVQRHARIHVGPFTCPHCVKVFVEKSEYCEHIKSEHADLMFQCKECDAVLPSKKAFMNHTLTQHSNAEMLLEGMKVKECPVCDKKFEKMSALERHMFVHSSEKSHECPACRKKYKFLPRLEQHIKEEHNNEVVFTCSECEEQFIFKGKLDLHVKLFHNGNYRCLTCYEVFPERLLLEEHQFKNHDISFECSKCKEKFETSLKLKHHLTEHTSQNNLCDICGAGFEHKAQLRTHLTDQHFGRDKSSMLKQYPGMAKVSVEILCDLCGEFWPSKPMYKQHLRDVHFGGDTVVMLQYFPYMEKISDPPEPATCDHCGKVCASITQLNFHLRSHMKTKERGKQKEELSSDDEQDDDVDLTNIEPREMDKNYRCSLCGAEFSRKAALEKHKAVHKKDEFKEALRELEKEEIARAELEEKEGFKPAPKAKKIGIVSSKTKPKVLKSLNKKSGKVKLPFPKTTGKKDSDTAEAVVGQKKRKQMHICRVCEEIFTTSQELTLHMQDDHGDVDFMAESEPENDHNTTVESSSMVKFDLSTFQCISCNKDFSCRKYLRKHLNRVHNYKQNPSAESPNSAGTQSVATSDIHESLKDSKSSGKNSSKKNEKKRKKEIDEDFEPVEEGFDDNADDSTADITAFLGKNFNLGKAHSCNIESVKKKQHRCSLCGERFSREATLKKHIALHESSEDLNMKPEFEDLMDFQPAIYPCTSCGNMYSTALGLIHHTRSKHSEVDEETVLAQIAEVDERLKLESPKKKMDSKASKSVKRKLDSDVEEFGDTTRKRMKLDKDSKESFECSLCGAVYCTFKGLKRHQQDIHSEEKVESQHSPVKYSHSGRLITKSKKLIEQIQCDKCSKTFLEARNLKLHVLRVHKADEFDKAQLIDNTASPDIGFKCDHCPKEFGRRINLRRHMKMKHNLELPPDSAETSSYESLSKGKHAGYHCNICEKKFTTSTGLHQHLVSFHDESDGNLVSVKAEPITCQICEQEFATKKTLEVHMRKHTGEKPYKCCLCNKQFISKYQLECHMKKLHTTLFAKKIKCKICLMLFETEKAMLKHKVVHKKLARDEDIDDNDEKDEDESGQHKCDQCSKSFRWKKNLMSHLETYHKNSDPQTCGVCNKVFPDMASVKAHMAEHQSTAVSYTCKICDKSFPKEVSLKMHESHMHKPKSSPSGMSCDVCKESFQTKMKLLEHMLTHTSMMPYKCDLCSASFKQEFRLKAHKLTHKIKNKKTEMTDTKKNKAPVTKGKESEKSQEVKEVTPKKFKCKKCTKQFNKLWLLRSHMSKSHKSKLPVNVAFMKNRATTRSRSSSETKTAPDKEEAPVKEKTKLKEKKNVSKDLKKGNKSTSFCKKCNLNFITTETYMKHLKTVHEKSKKGESSKQTELLKKSEKKVLLKSGTKTGKAKKEEKSTSKKSGKKEMIGHDCPVCKKMFSKQFRLRNHIKNVHKLEVDETPSPTGIKRTKCLYCTDCARVFWSQVKYDIHNKRFHPDKSALELDKQVMQAMSGEIKTEPDDGFSSPKQSDFETVQHKCEFCSKVHWTKKLFDEHMLKEHPEHAHEYGISGGEDTFKPSIELVNDSEDMMGNMLSVGLFDVSECDKLSSLPVVSIQRMNGNLNNLMAGNAQQEELEADIEMEERDVNEEVGGDGSIDRNKEVVDNETVTDQETFDMAGKTDSSSDVGCVISSVKTLQEMETGDTEEEESTVITDEQNVTDRHLENVNIVESALVSEEPNTSENVAGESRDESDKGENQYSREFEKFLQSSEVELDQHKEVEKPSEEDKDSKDDYQNVKSDDDLEVNTAGNNSSEVEQYKDSKVNPLSERVETCEEEFSQENAENETTEADGSEGIEEKQEVVHKSFRPRNGSEIDNENMEESDIEKDQEGIDWEAIDSEIEAAVEENYRESKEEEIGETSDVPDKVEDGRKENKTVVESDNANIVREEVSHGEGKQVEDEQTNHLEVYASAGNSDLDSNFTVTLNTEDDISDNSDAVDNGKQQESMADLKVIDESQEEMDVS